MKKITDNREQRKGNKGKIGISILCSLFSVLSFGAGAAKMCINREACAAGSWSPVVKVDTWTVDEVARTFSFNMTGHTFVVQALCSSTPTARGDFYGNPVPLGIAGGPDCASCWQRLYSVDGNTTCQGRWFTSAYHHDELPAVKSNAVSCAAMAASALKTYPGITSNTLYQY